VGRNGLKAQVPACEFTEGYWEMERGDVHTQKMKVLAVLICELQS